MVKTDISRPDPVLDPFCSL